jgi:polyhydroxybutyrate depolymerase
MIRNTTYCKQIWFPNLAIAALMLAPLASFLAGCGSSGGAHSAATVSGAATSTCDFSHRVAGTGGTQTCTISYNDPTDGPVTRELRLHIPPGLNQNSGIVFFMHGGGGDFYEGEAATRFTPLSDSTNAFVAVYPRGTIDALPEHSRTWNTLLPNDPSVWAGPAPDDVNFVRQITGLLEAQLPIDPKQVYATGLSVGGFMAHRLGVELSDVLASVAVVEGSLHAESFPPHTVTEHIKGPISVLIFHGDADNTFPYCGTNTGSAYIASQDETFNYWTGSSGNSCTRFDTTQNFCNNGVINNAILEKDATGCSGGVEVKHLKLVAGNHQWYEQITNQPPGSVTTPYNPNVSPNLVGETALMWNFFNTHRKP